MTHRSPSPPPGFHSSTGPGQSRRGALRAVAVAAAGLALAACSGSSPLETFDLSVPPRSRTSSPGGRQLVVAEPVALQPLEADRIMVKAGDGSVSYLPGVQWADRLPRLLQSRLVQTFENDGRAVGRAGNGVAADLVLQSDIRFFGISTVEGSQAVVEISAKLVDGSSGRILSARVFRGAQPVGALNGKAAAQALDGVTVRVLQDIVRWAGGASRAAPKPVAAPADPSPSQG
ncbi:MAG: ABC-type transport auxiliary lipoprotein family protein [Alsobacter sp.]